MRKGKSDKRKEGDPMRILMLGNSFTFYNDMPSTLAELTGAEVIHHTRGGARLAEQLNPETQMGAKTQEALEKESWDYVVLQEMSNGPIIYRESFMNSVASLCERIKYAGAIPILYATWAYQKDCDKLDEMGLAYDIMAAQLSEAYHEAADRNDALIAEVGQRFYEQAEKKDLYAEDGQHPNEAGSRLAAETIAAVIAADQEKKKTEAVRLEISEKVGDNDTRLRILYMYQLLLKYTDEEHPLTTNEIRALMEKEHGITMHRTTVSSDVELLTYAGYPIQVKRSRANKYFFSLTSDSNASSLTRHLYPSGRVKSGNEKGYYIVDAINQAINSGKRISFLYTDYNGKKQQILRNNGKPYTVSPYALVWNGDYYYLVGWYHEKDRMNTFRVDRILTQPKVLQEAAQPEPENFDIGIYTKEVFRMYDTEEPQQVTLFCDNSVMKGVIDKFGTDIKVQVRDEDHFSTKVMVCASPTFYSWVFQWGGKIRIAAPKDVVKGYQDLIRKALE